MKGLWFILSSVLFVIAIIESVNGVDNTHTLMLGLLCSIKSNVVE